MSVRDSEVDPGGRAESNDRNGKETGCQTISLLAFLEEENRDLRKAVISLALETLALRNELSHHGADGHRREA
jgi:hypothetical protein